MSQNDFVIANAPGGTVRADMNSAFAALASLSSGATAPATPYANMWWHEDDTDILWIRDEANTAWIAVASKVGAVWAPYLNGVTTDATGGATGDLIPFIDVSDADATNKVTVADLIYNAITNATADAAPDMAADSTVTRDNSASGYKKVLLGLIGAGKQTVWLPAGAMTARTTAGAAAGTAETATNRVMIKTLDFDTTTQEFAQFQIQMPKGWNEGTVTFIVVWSHAATTVNFGAAWSLAGLALSDDDAQDTAFGTAIVVTDTGGTTNDLYRTAESAAVTIGNTPVEGDVVVFQVARVPADAADTMAIDARLHGIALFYTTNANTDT